MAKFSRLETSQQFEDAFEELYQRSPMPILVKSSLLPRQSPMPKFPVPQTPNGVGVKAIFDMMKQRNSSASSELNVSTSTSSGDAVASNQLAGNCQQRKDKENLTPEKKRSNPVLPEARMQVELTTDQSVAQAPANNTNSSEESHADQETLQLVNKLVQRLHSCAENGDSDFDSDIIDSTEGAMSGPLSNQGRKDITSAEVEESSAGKTVLQHGGSLRTQHKQAADETKSKTIAVSANSRTFSKNATQAVNGIASNKSLNEKNCEKMPAKVSAKRQSEHNDNSVKNHLKLKQKKGTAVTEDLTDNDRLKGKTASRKKSSVSVKSKQTISSSKVTAVSDVETDVISQRPAGQEGSNKEPFSLDASYTDTEAQVEEDVIVHTSRKPQKDSPVREKGKGTAGRVFQSFPKKACKTDDGHGAKTGSSCEDKSKVLKLSSWSLQPVARRKQVRIEGKLPKTDYFWLSSVIVERVSSRLVKSANGSLYQLIGHMSRLNTRAAGFSEEVVWQFRYGFPRLWDKLLDSNLETLDQCPTPVQLDAVTEQTRQSRLSQQKEGKKQQTVEKSSTPPQKKTVSAEAYHTPEQVKPDANKSSAIWTPQGVMSRALEAKQLVRTQSGRCVIPRLARWAGQYMERDASGNITFGFASTTAEQHFAKVAEQEMNVPVRMKYSSMVTSYRITTMTGETSTTKVAPTRVNSHHTSQQSAVRDKTVTCKNKQSKHLSSISKTKKSAGREECPENSLDSVAMINEVNVDDVDKEVMALLQKSKENRLKKAAKKRTTCYSNVDQERDKRKSLSAFDYSEDEEDDKLADERNSITREAAKMNVSVTRLRKGCVKGKQESRAGDAEEEAVQMQPAYRHQSLVSRRRKMCNDGDFEATRHGDPVRGHRETNMNVSSSNDWKRVKSRSGKNTKKVTTAQNLDNLDGSSNDELQVSITDSTEDSELKGNDWKRQNTSACKDHKQQKSRRKGKGKGVKSAVKKSVQTACRTRRGSRSEDDDNYTSAQSGQQLEQGDEDSDSELSESITDFERKGNISRNKKKENDISHNSVRRSTRNRKAETGAQKGISLTEGDQRPWSSEEMRKLQKATENISSDTHQFWEAVCQVVGTRSSEECAAFYLQDKPDTKDRGKNKTQTKAKQGGSTPSLQGKRGTLKRRRELRAILEHECNNGEQDDLFHATPFRTKRKAKVPCVDFSKSDKEVFGRNPNFFTPKQDGSQEMSGAISHTPVSSRKTPSIYSGHNPWQDSNSSQKRDVEQYVHRLQKNKRQLSKSFNKKKSQKQKDQEYTAPHTPSARLFSQSLAPGLFQISEEKSCDEEEDGTDYYYYSDDAEN